MGWFLCLNSMLCFQGEKGLKQSWSIWDSFRWKILEGKNWIKSKVVVVFHLVKPFLETETKKCLSIQGSLLYLRINIYRELSNFHNFEMGLQSTLQFLIPFAFTTVLWGKLSAIPFYRWEMEAERQWLTSGCTTSRCPRFKCNSLFFCTYVEQFALKVLTQM